MKVKIGQIYEIKKASRNKCGSFSGSSNAKYIRIRAVNTNGLNYEILGSSKQHLDSCTCFHVEDLVASKGRPKKVMYIATYMVNSVDPVEEFGSQKELDEWLAEAKQNSAIVFESIRVYSVSGVYEVKTSFSLEKVQ